MDSVKEKNTSITEKEFEVINIIASGIPLNQRELARQSGMSLGMANLLLHRLVQKGYLRAQQLDRRKFSYLLTPKGFSEKARKSYRYTLKTLSSIALLKDRVQAIVRDQHSRGTSDFILLGRGVLADVADLALRDMYLPSFHYQHLNEIPESLPNRACLLLADEPKCSLPERLLKIDLMAAVSKTPELSVHS